MDIENLYEIFNELRNSVVVVDRNNIVIWNNDWLKYILGNKEILIGKNFYDYFDFIKKDNKKTYIISKQSNEKFYYKKFEINNYSYIVILLYSIQNFNEDYNKLFCYEKIFQSINDGILLTDFKGHIQILNSSQEKMENEKSENLLGKFLWDIYDYDSEEGSEHRMIYREKKPIIDKYKLFTYKNGFPTYLYYNTYPILKDNEVVAVFSVRKKEEKLQELLSETIELKRKLADKNSEDNKNNTPINGTIYTFSDIVGNSEITKNLIKEAQTIALLDRNVLIIGETGTGKEMFAQSIHNYVNNQEPFVAINCGAIPENLLESILFGAVKGSYTGAVDKSGLFEEAGKGTLFLDELNSMPVSMQTKLLRVLQEKKIRRIGDVKTYKVECRVISAINENPKDLMNSGLLRKDLFYRISGLTLNLPPLRKRVEDISYLIYFYINKYNNSMNKNIKSVERALENILLKYKWPGNVRELEYIIENLMIRVKNEANTLTIDELPEHLKTELMDDINNDSLNACDKLLNQALEALERRMILESLNDTNWNISRSAKNLGIIRQSLLYRMKRLNIEKK